MGARDKVKMRVERGGKRCAEEELIASLLGMPAVSWSRVALEANLARDGRKGWDGEG